ncbi:MAG: adenylate/guanylate cyclase domain-containing protein [Hyphomicrobiaceae bacterium]
MRVARGGVSLTITLAVSISLLVLIAVVAVLGLGLTSGMRNTMSLLRDKSEIIVSTMVDKVRSHLEPAQSQLEFMEGLIAQGRLDPADKDRLTTMMTGSLAAAPQISAILFVNKELKTLIVARAPGGRRGDIRVFRRDDRGDAIMEQAIASAQATNGAAWGKPLWRDLAKETMLNLRIGVRRNGEFLGVLIAAVSVRRLSNYLGQLDPAAGANVFVLYDRNRVLAHPNLAGAGFVRSAEEPMLGLAKVGDPVLAAIWRRQDRYPLRILKGTDLKGHVLQIFNDEYIYIYRDVGGLGEKAWQIGTYFRSADVNSELQRLKRAMIAGLALLALSVIVAVLLARQIARPIVKLAGAASRIGQLEISQTRELPGSMFRELNDQAQAFNAMLHGLRWFEAYVPKKLVRRLIRQGDTDVVKSEERDVTVMFTDIAGFTSLSEGVSAPDIAYLLNDHFAKLAACIEAEGGTVDKFIGDSVMAFWGAPDAQPDHAERAVRAARSILVAVNEDNEKRVTNGQAPIGLRVGLHTGPVTVGNIGSPDRINYTIIGDAVNVGQRLEQFAKGAGDESATSSSLTVVASRAIVDQVAEKECWASLGMHRLRGRDEKIEIFRMR